MDIILILVLWLGVMLAIADCRRAYIIFLDGFSLRGMPWTKDEIKEIQDNE